MLKRAKKRFLAVCVPLFVILPLAISAIILEPVIQIAGFATFDENKISFKAKTVTVFGYDGKEIGILYTFSGAI